jgi:rhodanese-related sulfurtransferase
VNVTRALIDPVERWSHTVPYELEQEALPFSLEIIRAQARAADLRYAGAVPPVEAWRLVQADSALLVDVRSSEERKYVGHVPCSYHVPWATGMALQPNPRFIRELEARIGGPLGKEAVILLLCRSGTRSALAAAAATKAGFSHAFNVLDGFEGGINSYGQRGVLGGWRFHRLPWVQD